MNTNDITLSQLTTATTNTGKIVVKMYKEQAEQRNTLDVLTNVVNDLATQQQSVDVAPIVTNLDAMRTEQVEAIENIANIVKPLLGAQADIKESLLGELTSVRATLEKHELVLQKLITTLGVMSEKLIQLDSVKHDVNELKETTVETSSRVKTLGVQLSSLMVNNTASEDELITLMTETNALLEETE